VNESNKKSAGFKHTTKKQMKKQAEEDLWTQKLFLYHMTRD
jgi:hypothetical protein